LNPSGRALYTIAAKVLILDNNDSFTWNLVEAVRATGLALVEVVPTLLFDPFDDMDADGIILSPGPGLPQEFPAMEATIQLHGPHTPILGICLGHQAIAQAFGGSLVNLREVRHGKQAEVEICDHSTLFPGLPHWFQAGLYHSWAVSAEGLSPELKVTARDRRGVIMGIRHHSMPLEGVQFHPESYLTPLGYQMIRNWVRSLG